MPDAYFGPLNNTNQLGRVEGMIERTPAHADVVAGGHRVGERGYLYAPTVVAGLRQDDELIQDEIFGPVITVQRFTDEDEAVRWANGVKYGLASSVWTGRTTAARCGWPGAWTSAWCGSTPHPDRGRDAHGGFKHSGYGKDLYVYGFRGLHPHRARHELHRFLVSRRPRPCRGSARCRARA